MFRQAKDLERQGRWRLACQKFHQILDIDPYDAHSHLGLARLEARREHHKNNNSNNNTATSTSTSTSTATAEENGSDNQCNAREAFHRGTSLCPNSIHLWQAWAIYEESQGNIEEARRIFERALDIDAYNPYVCHAYGLMEKNKCQQPEHAQQLWEQALTKASTAALVCSLGELFTAQNQCDKARDLYSQHLSQLSSPKDKTEVYLAMAWLEERYYEDYDRAHKLLQLALDHFPSSSLVHVALARLEGRRRQQVVDSDEGKKATVRRLVNAIIHMEQEVEKSGDGSSAAKKKERDSNNNFRNYNKRNELAIPSDQDGGRIYNAWAHLEMKDRKFDKARRILARGMQRFPQDPMVSSSARLIIFLVFNCPYYVHDFV